LNAGRNRQAIKDIKQTDSDGDSFTNDEEILELRYPGNDQSRPDQETAKLITVNMEQLKSMAYHEQFMLANTTKQQFDDYVSLCFLQVVVRNYYRIQGFSVFIREVNR